MNRRLIAIMLGIGVAATACGDDAKPKQAGGVKKESSSSSSSSSSIPQGPTFALRGTPDEAGVGATRPVISVKIPNNRELHGGSQLGLAEADVVYEEVVEGQATRYLAMFHSTLLDRVGPVRSVRLVDPDIVWPVQGIFAYSGGAPTIVPKILAAPVNAVDETKAQSTKALFRDRSVSRTTEFTLFADLNKLLELGGTPAPPPALFEYRPEKTASVGDPIIAAKVGFSDATGAPTWTWDPAKSVFTRSYDNTPHMSGANQITAANVIVQFIRYDGGLGREGSKGVVIGAGDAWVLSDGKLIKGTWTRDKKESVTKFLGPDGDPILLTPGNTWVELADLSYQVGVFPAAPPAGSSSSSSTTKSNTP